MRVAIPSEYHSSMFCIKICGVTSPADATMIADAGADAIGLNFYPPSPRYVDAEKAKKIIALVPSSMQCVGVFVETTSVIRGLEAVQTYREPPFDDDFGLPHIPAFRIRNAEDLASIRAYVRGCVHRPAAILVDGHSSQWGGTGSVAPWELLAGFDPGVPLILAGGLTPENVAEAIRIVRPFGVDVASGVESKPGVKDSGKVRAFVQAARGAFSAL